MYIAVYVQGPSTEICLSLHVIASSMPRAPTYIYMLSVFGLIVYYKKVCLYQLDSYSSVILVQPSIYQSIHMLRCLFSRLGFHYLMFP